MTKPSGSRGRAAGSRARQSRSRAPGASSSSSSVGGSGWFFPPGQSRDGHSSSRRAAGPGRELRPRGAGAQGGARAETRPGECCVLQGPSAPGAALQLSRSCSCPSTAWEEPLPSLTPRGWTWRKQHRHLSWEPPSHSKPFSSLYLLLGFLGFLC